MTILLSPDAVAARAPVARGGLALLAQSLRADLAPLLEAGEPWFPPEKARLTRIGGRCPTHGVLLDFDPWQPKAHRCSVCGTTYSEDEHYRWWIMNYQLWLAERAVHAATLHVLTGDAPCGVLAQDILRGYASRYAQYPNRDNVLGPTRPFFSTYLESIWLLQLTVALDLLEARGGRHALGEEVRERLVRPSAAIIASYDEGMSNRQVYNNAAMAAAGALLGDEALVSRAIDGPSGLASHLTQSLLADGTWYEGENYHLFAHRGLWYGVTIAEALGHPLAAEGRRRFAEGFATPFATALPDFTFPSRRDSQYRVSLRQWRMAESCELGVARGDDDRLGAALAELYRRGIPEGETGRARSTAEAERNLPPVQLSRASLGWKSLLFARAALPPLGGKVPASVQLAGQGLAVLRRDQARAYVALDYGESGGGHGHPDRLNLWLVVGNARILEDVGTGSYVDPTLHWYRSTLAHNAPLADGRSQWRVSGALTAYDERGESGLVAARATIAPGVVVERTVVAMSNYVVDEVRWRADRVVTFDLPYHVDAELASGGRWRTTALAGGRGLEDGFDFVSASEYVAGTPGLSFEAQLGEVPVRAWVYSDTPHEWWRCVAPGPPGEARRRFLLLRTRGRAGVLRTVWNWTGEVTSCVFERQHAVVHFGAWARHVHGRDEGRWRVTFEAGGTASTIDFVASPDAASQHAHDPARDERRDGSTMDSTHAPSDAGGAPDVAPDIAPDIAPDDALRAARPGGVVLRRATDVPAAPGALARGETRGTGPDGGDPVARFVLGEASYRRSEPTWREAGCPRARVAVVATASDVVVDVDVETESVAFAPACTANPLDNEHPDINSDGLQLYLGSSHGSGRYYAWLLVPELDGASVGVPGAVRVSTRAAFGPAVTLTATAALTSTGWALRATIPRDTLALDSAGDFTLDLIVNEISPGRERRQGQLVLSGGHDEWVYLRGDRQDAARALRFHLADV
ncbi:MAG: heparinase II/III family protein [Gemmatimonadetes bacterium]|nr:heparinase II/III family protein [Gemmatimonadota bacterium]